VSANQSSDAVVGVTECEKSSVRAGLFSPLIDEIVEQHHRYVREDTPRINAILEKCAADGGESAEAIGAVARFFGELADELAAHFLREERELFPVLRAADEGRPHESIGPIVARFRAEHAHAGDALTRTHVSLAEALLPEGARPEIKELHWRLVEFEADLKAHVRAEDMLFARATGLDGRPVVGRNRR
jgi:regulator of cell morphogenesis and NO signaling